LSKKQGLNLVEDILKPARLNQKGFILAEQSIMVDAVYGPQPTENQPF